MAKLMNHIPRITRQTRIWIVCLILMTAWPVWVSAAPACKAPVVVLNSDQSVKKYAALQAEFKKSLDLATVDIDLGEIRNDIQVIQKTLSQTLPELIVCIGGKAYLTAHQLAPATPKVFCLGINWHQYPITDTTYIISPELPFTSQLTMFRYFFPQVRKMGVMYSESLNRKWFSAAAKEAMTFGITLVGAAVTDNDDVHEAETSVLANTDALWLIADSRILSGKKRVMDIFHTAHTMKKPVFTYHRVFSSLGAAFILSADIHTMARQAAQTVLKLCARKEIVQQVQEPAGTYIAINMEKINALDIRLNPRALSQVNELIESSPDMDAAP